MILSKAFKYWHWLSLDAPTIAILWTYFASICFQISVTYSTLAALFIAVWILYTSDRLLDVARPKSRERLAERHFFHQKHRVLFVSLILFASGLLGYLCGHLPYAMIRLYVFLGIPVLVYFSLVHSGLREFPKEFVVGFIFAIATFIPLIHAGTSQNLEMSYAFLFGVVCSLNCLFIKTWEDGSVPILAIICVIFVFMATLKSFPIPPFFEAILLSAITLVALHLFRRRFSDEKLRICADIALLTPLVVLLRMSL